MQIEDLIPPAQSQEAEDLIALLEAQDEAHTNDREAGPNVARFIMDMLRQPKDLVQQAEAWQMVRQESRHLADFNRMTVGLSFSDKALVYETTLRPSFARMGEWAFSYARQCVNCRRLFLSIDRDQRACCGWQYKAWLKTKGV